MRSLKYLIKKEKPLVDRNTDVLNNIFLPNNYLSVGENINSVLRITNLPNTPIGLTEGSVWRDGDGFLRIV